VKHPHQSSWVEIDLKAIRFNYEQLKRLAIKQFDPAPLRIPTLRRKGSYPQILPVIKADAYGHGMKEVGTLLNKLGVGLLCVSDLSEGIDLRRQGVMKPILLLESTLPSLAKDIIDYRLTPTVVTWPLALALNRYAKLRKRIVCVHVKVDTGMGRLGVPYPQAQDFINRLMKLSHLQVEGLYTHFPVADTDYPFTMGQIEKLYQMVKFFDRQGKISYGHTFVTKKSMTVATLPIGYQDGYLRSLSNKAAVLIDGKRCTILGRVTMDQIIVDVSKVKNPRIGMEAVILGKQGNEEISANDLARQAGTINYEIICSLGNRLPRIYKR